MLDIGWSELLVVGVVALIVVGPKDLPILFRRMGEFTGQAKRMAREFTRAMDQAADEAGVKDIQKDLRKMANPKQMGLDAFKDATGDIGKDLDDWADLDDETKRKGTAPAADEPLSEERAEAAEKIRAATAATATARQADEAAAAAAATGDVPQTMDQKPT